MGLNKVNDIWIWPETNFIQPLVTDYWWDDHPRSFDDCGHLYVNGNGSGYISSFVCDVKRRVLCMVKGK